MTAVLLDTCAAIWLSTGESLSPAASAAIEQAALDHGVLVSAVSAWEIGMLANRRRDRTFDPDPTGWFDRLLTGPGIVLAPCTPALMIASTCLPNWDHRDPADCLIVATARLLDVPVVTRDHLILDYAATGAVGAIRC